jgi:hypothetical protein
LIFNNVENQKNLFTSRNEEGASAILDELEAPSARPGQVSTPDVQTYMLVISGLSYTLPFLFCTCHSVRAFLERMLSSCMLHSMHPPQVSLRHVLMPEHSFKKAVALTGAPGRDTHPHTHARTRMHACTHAHVHTNKHTRARTHTHTHTYTHTHIHTLARTHARTHRHRLVRLGNGERVDSMVRRMLLKTGH